MLPARSGAGTAAVMNSCPAQGGPADQAAADVVALIARRPGLRRAVEVAESAADEVLAGAHGKRRQLANIERALHALDRGHAARTLLSA
jgi:hypothetical protein